MVLEEKNSTPIYIIPYFIVNVKNYLFYLDRNLLEREYRLHYIICLLVLLRLVVRERLRIKQVNNILYHIF